MIRAWALCSRVEALLCVPVVGRLVTQLWNLILTGLWGALSLPVDLAVLLIARLSGRAHLPAKRLRVRVCFARDGVDAVRRESLVRAAIACADRILTPAGVVLQAEVLGVAREPVFQQAQAARCGAGAWWQDCGRPGARMQDLMRRLDGVSSWRRLCGYGAPLFAFDVAGYFGGGVAGCSLGPPGDYVTINFARAGADTMTHEIGHACNLWHAADPGNLMFPYSKPPSVTGTTATLRAWQIGLLRLSRHVTYF